MDESIAHDSAQFVDDYIMLHAAANSQRALRQVIQRGADTVEAIESHTGMQSQGDKCAAITELELKSRTAPVTAEEVKELGIPHTQCPDCKSLFETFLGLKRHAGFCPAADTPWHKTNTPVAGFEGSGNK